MPHEKRQIVFSKAELIDAIHEYYKTSQDRLPPGTIQDCIPAPEQGVAVHLKLYDTRSEESVTVPLSPETVGAALLRCCIDNGIPMAKNSEKSIQFHGEDVSLNIAIHSSARRSNAGYETE